MHTQHQNVTATSPKTTKESSDFSTRSPAQTLSFPEKRETVIFSLLKQKYLLASCVPKILHRSFPRCSLSLPLLQSQRKYILLPESFQYSSYRARAQAFLVSQSALSAGRTKFSHTHVCAPKHTLPTNSSLNQKNLLCSTFDNNNSCESCSASFLRPTL